MTPSTPTRLALAGLALAACAGCATPARPDPIEPFNRKVFGFNETLDRAVVKPVAKAYVNVLPQFARTGVHNFFANLGDAWSAANLLLQGRPGESLGDVARFGTNTTVGVLGLFDVATPAGLERHAADFGQTLGVWGLGSGAYLVLPLFGPSSVRDTAGLSVDLWAAPLQQLGLGVPVRNGLTGLDIVDSRAGLLSLSAMLDDDTLDRYLFVRDAYLQRRRGQVERERKPAAVADADAAASASAPAPAAGAEPTDATTRTAP